MFDTAQNMLKSAFWTGGFTNVQDSEISRLKSGMAAGMAAGTRVAGPRGWCAIEDVAVGDYVLTFDGGMQIVTGITHGVLWAGQAACPEALWPLRVPVGALGNLQEMYLLPEQSVMIESDTAEVKMGDPFALLPAASLEGFCGIERVYPREEIQVFILHFEQDEVVFANIGALFYAPQETDQTMAQAVTLSRYHTLPMDQACVLAEWMALERADLPSTPQMRLV